MKILLLFTTLLFAQLVFGQSGAFGYKQLTETQRKKTATFHLPNNSINKEALERKKWKLIAENNQWIYFSTTAEELHSAYVAGEIADYYIEYAPPHLLSDSMRKHHKVDEVHEGQGLSSSYTGKDIIVGFVDTGIEVNHPDFKDENGKTRILRIWQQENNSGSTPSPYGYGVVWDSTQINAGLYTGVDPSGHGTTVAGAATGNGLATGYNKGVAPDADIIMVVSDFNRPNWTESVADACDYIFKVADSLGKKAVINLSVGTYLGSHDGTDPASVRIENLLDEKEGRIVVSACGNSGAIGNYHCQGNVTSDTSFVWFINNPSSSFGANKIFFDLYSTGSEATYEYAFSAINPNANFTTRAITSYRNALGSLGTPIYDTLRNENGQRIATIEIYSGMEGSNLHMQVLFRNIDSTGYYYGFNTVGSGKFDLWSGIGLGYNNMVETLPSPAVLPSIIHYNMPDANQTIVSSWNCSPKVVSVGNTRTRITYTDYNGDLFVGDPFPPVGHLSQNSSKGPNRLNVIKPDVSASGDGTMAAAPLWILAEPINYFRIDEGGWHMRNGGTSMASPVVAGTAALFLERCDKGNYATFIQELHASATSNDYTGNLPNNAYGHGWLDAHQLMLNQEFTASLVADTAFCVPPVAVEIEATDSIYQAVWSNGSTDFPYYQHTSGALSAIAYNAAGCGVNTDTLDFVQLATETIDPIVVAPDFSYLTTTSSNDTYQWTYNGTDIAGATGDTLYLTSGMQAGSYDCYTTSTDGCSTYAGAVSLNLTVQQNIIQTIEVYPNPTSSMLYINSEDEVLSAQIIDISGKVISATIQNNAVKVNHLSNGFYTLQLNTAKGIASFKFVKQ